MAVPPAELAHILRHALVFCHHGLPPDLGEEDHSGGGDRACANRRLALSAFLIRNFVSPTSDTSASSTGGTSDGSVTQEQAGQMRAFSTRGFSQFCIAFSKQARYNQRKVTTRQEPHSVVGTGEAIAKVRDRHLGGA